jgi:hypothetical protein
MLSTRSQRSNASLHVRSATLMLLMCLSLSTVYAAPFSCAADATQSAKKLINFHMGEGFEDRISLDSPTPQHRMKNPANPTQYFEVWQVDGDVSPHGHYRMRLIFYRMTHSCLLMGQEILEHANL